MAFSFSTFFKDAETGAAKVVHFILSHMVAAENLLGAKTGSAKLNVVISGVEAALAAFGIPVGTVEKELEVVVDALVALFKKANIPIASSTAAPAQPAKK